MQISGKLEQPVATAGLGIEGKSRVGSLVCHRTSPGQDLAIGQQFEHLVLSRTEQTSILQILLQASKDVCAVLGGAAGKGDIRAGLSSFDYSVDPILHHRSLEAYSSQAAHPLVSRLVQSNPSPSLGAATFFYVNVKNAFHSAKIS